jgi:hypothetical protein
MTFDTQPGARLALQELRDAVDGFIGAGLEHVAARRAR